MPMPQWLVMVVLDYRIFIELVQMFIMLEEVVELVIMEEQEEQPRRGGRL